MSKTKEIKAPQWEIKTRVYYLLHSITPLTFTLQTKHSTQYPLLHFDKNTMKCKLIDIDFQKKIIHFRLVIALINCCKLS